MSRCFLSGKSFLNLVKCVVTLLFDFGGTLDADGVAWPSRFYSLYKEEGVEASWEEFCRAFYDSDDNLASRHRLDGLGLEETVSLQAGWTAKALAPGDRTLAERVAARFTADSRRVLARNRPILERLARGHRLGVVSNFYGNIESVLAGEGYLELFGAVAESARVGALKPDPRLFRWALDRLGGAAAEAWMIGDSKPRDMRGAEGLGMPHAWVAGPRDEEPCCPSAAVLRSLPELEDVLAAAR